MKMLEAIVVHQPSWWFFKRLPYKKGAAHQRPKTADATAPFNQFRNNIAYFFIYLFQ